MNKYVILHILSKVPRYILLACAEVLMKNKKQISLTNSAKISQTKAKSKQNPNPIKKKMSKTFNVMLAHAYDPDKHSKKVVGWWMSVKYDGVRALWNGEEMESRTGHVYTLPEFLTDQLKSIKDEDGDPMMLDGELWAGNGTFTFLSGLARRHENEDDMWKNVNYMVFDTPNTDLPFEERIKSIKNALKRAGNPPAIKLVKFTKYDPALTSIETELKKVEEEGGEGLILRKPYSLYTFKRSHEMLKVKSWTYKEGVVTGYVEGTGKYKGMVGSLMVESNELGDEGENEEETPINFKVGSGLTDWQRYSGGIEGNWKTKEVQQAVDKARRNMIKEIDKTSKNYVELINTINTTSGKERSDALHALNNLFSQMPVIGDVITFRYKETTKDGKPTMPTFVTVRNYE